MRIIAITILLALAAVSAPARAAAETTVTLTEFRTHDGAGWYYATDAKEITAAQEQYAMTEPRAVAQLQSAYFAGSVPLYRLRTTARNEYLLTSSGSEVSTLLNSGHFQYERILGYISRSPAPGMQEIDRMNNGKTWRVTEISDRPQLTATGFTVDGPLGYAG